MVQSLAIQLTQGSRSIKGSSGVDFRKQLAELNGEPQQQKKFRSYVPKGSKLAAGFHDRTKDRVDEEEDDKAKRIKALEESLKLEQIDQATFEQLRDQITGGDIGATHLVKGLDRRLLDRARRGEDVWSGAKKEDKEQAEAEPEEDVDDAFEQLEERDVAPMQRDKAEKKGEMAPPPPVAGTKRSRNDILAELKAQRKAAAEAKAAAQPQLGAKFKKIGVRQEESRIERNEEKGIEILITTDENGNVKRKVRKLQRQEMMQPDPEAKPLGMEVPEVPVTPKKDESEDDDDIFEGVGADYDPLADLDDDDDDNEEDGDAKPTEKRPADPDRAAMPPPPLPTTSKAPRNYFKDIDEPSESTTAPNVKDLFNNPTIRAALMKARKKDGSAEDKDAAAPADTEEEARLKRRAAMLASTDRDLEDMDMGFGSSFAADAEDEGEEGGGKAKLAEWKGLGAADDDEDEGGDRKGGAKRKRGPKKKKGDKNSASDVLKVIEKRKAGK